MTRIIRFIWLIGTLGCQSRVIIAQISDVDKKSHDVEVMDSLSKAAIKWEEDAIREHELHKDNKDSAWILDYSSDTFNIVVWDARSKSKEGKAITIIDSLTNNYYVL